MVNNTAMMLILQSEDQNDKDEWMDASDKDINGIIQTLDYKDKLKEKNPPSAIKSSQQQYLVMKGKDNCATFVSAASSTHNTTSHIVAFHHQTKRIKLKTSTSLLANTSKKREWNQLMQQPLWLQQ
eukprot:12765300-Ditylum_brightwellii.AAC.1